MRGLYPFVMIGGLLYWFVSDTTGIGWYLETGNKETDLTIGWVMFAGLAIMCVKLLSMVFSEPDEEEEQKPVKKGFWDDWYDD